MVLKKLKLPLINKSKREISQSDLKKALVYIDDYWGKLTHYQPDDKGMAIGLPNAYVVPSADPEVEFIYEEQFYWDSYFTGLGLLKEEHKPLVEGMLENLLHLLRRFEMIPNASAMYQMSHSQPPILTTYIFDVYERFGKSTEWLANHMALAEMEYHTVWMSSRQPHWRLVYKGLNRYYDIHVLHDLAEAESGWDMTTRFERKCLDFLPVDLNSLLYKYETDFARTAEIVGDSRAAKTWHKRAAVRKRAMNELMWGKLRGFYFDYNYENKRLGDVWSLAGFYPMWAGMASDEQAKRMVDNLGKFEKIGGLSTTAGLFAYPAIFGSLRTQWAYPNGWAPLQYIVIAGLRRYGYHAEAERIARKWIKTNLDWYHRHGVFLEKYNVVNPKKPPIEGVYPSQTGFAWTNSVFVRLVHDFELLDD